MKKLLNVIALSLFLLSACDTGASKDSEKNPIIPSQQIVSSSSSSQQPMDTTQWKSYRNTKYGYGFLYPSDLLEPLSNCGGMGQDYVEPVEVCPLVRLHALSLRTIPESMFDIFDNTENMTAVNYLKALLVDATIYEPVASTAYGKREAAKAIFGGALKSSIDPLDQGGTMYERNPTIIVIKLSNQKVLQVVYFEDQRQLLEEIMATFTAQ